MNPIASALRPMTPLLSMVLVGAAMPALAQTTSAPIPDSGVLLRQVQPTPAPAASKRDSALTIDRPKEAPAPASTAFVVRRFQITGNTIFDTPTLLALIGNAQGQALTLPQLNELAGRITAYYQGRGYPLARAIIPAQTISSGELRIDVIEARYGAIALDNASRVNDRLLQATLSSLRKGSVIEQDELDHALLLLSDIPGTILGATLKPGDAVGTSDLLVNISPGASASGDIVLDDYGNRYTGRARIMGTASLYNPLRHGDTLSVSGLSTGRGFDYARLGYDLVLNGSGTGLGASYLALRYKLGAPLAALQAHGTVQSNGLWLKQALVYRKEIKLYGMAQFESTQLRDRIDSSATRTDRTIRLGTFSLGGEVRDGLIAGAITSWSVGWTKGHNRFDDDAARVADAASANTQGTFVKRTASVARTQSFGLANSLTLSVSGQWADTNLDSSQKMGGGGPQGVRAYGAGAASGDQGYLASAEYRQLLWTGWAGQWSGAVFVDGARLKVNKDPWGTSENSITLRGAGMGVDWAGPDKWAGRAYVAKPLGTISSLVGATKSVQAWVQLNRHF